MSIGANIKKLRLLHDMSQQDLARIAGVTDKAVSSWENDVKTPRMGAIQKIADHFNIKKSDIIEDRDMVEAIENLEKLNGQGIFSKSLNHTATYIPNTDAIIHSYKIPILGRVAAGIPIEAHEEILGYQYINEEYRNDGYSYFALRICGKSMEPTIMDGDIVVVRQQTTVDSGDIAIVLIDGEDATAKEVKESPEGITLVGHNVAVYTPHFYSNKDIEELPVQIIGKVIQAIRKF